LKASRKCNDLGTLLIPADNKRCTQVGAQHGKSLMPPVNITITKKPPKSLHSHLISELVCIVV
jgi:hypothetical protein